MPLALSQWTQPIHWYLCATEICEKKSEKSQQKPKVSSLNSRAACRKIARSWTFAATVGFRSFGHDAVPSSFGALTAVLTETTGSPSRSSRM